MQKNEQQLRIPVARLDASNASCPTSKYNNNNNNSDLLLCQQIFEWIYLGRNQKKKIKKTSDFGLRIKCSFLQKKHEKA